MAKSAFRGQIYQRVDSKARVSIPVEFRRILDAEFTPTPDSPRTSFHIVYGGKGQDYATCYSDDGKARMEERIANRSAFDEKEAVDRERLITSLVSRSASVEIDMEGRIVLPNPVRIRCGFTAEHIAKGGEAAFVGRLDEFRLYRRDIYEAEMAKYDEEDDGVDPLLMLRITPKPGVA